MLTTQSRPLTLPLQSLMPFTSKDLDRLGYKDDFLNQIKNYAAGGARTYHVRSQINQYLSANTPGPNTLLAPSWAGVGWDVLDHRPVEQVVSNYAMNISGPGMASWLAP